MSLKPPSLDHYHVFLSSPGDLPEERRAVHHFFHEYNQRARRHGFQFDVVDHENYATFGVGRPQELITQETLEKFRESLALVIGLMGQRFGTPTGEAESGTEEEFNWAHHSHQDSGFPEIKWFFRKVDQFQAPPDPKQIQAALDQWEKVRAFRQRLGAGEKQLYYAEFSDIDDFRDTLRKDLELWLGDDNHKWNQRSEAAPASAGPLQPPNAYYQSIIEDFQWLDISGIDRDKAFDIPLSEVYVRLRVIFDEDSDDAVQEGVSGPIGIQDALSRYQKLVIVGDPGSGKSTFLRFIALMIARPQAEFDLNLAEEALSLEPPFPTPIFVSCWDLSDDLRSQEKADLPQVLAFLAQRLASSSFPISSDDLESLLRSGDCCLLFDGLDEVPTDQARARVSRLVEKFVARYKDNRFVITSRVRAYSGDTVLRGGFTRCDLQPFNSDDRAQFLRNWFALLFKVAPAELESHARGAAEFDALTAAIENSPRIRPLAVNPLLLTVISIVHWNRKRLPEQRVELYGECVDVLLGQRKQAERAHSTFQIEKLSDEAAGEQYEEQAWVRKRFAEIALLVQSSEGDDVTKRDVLNLLIPRFRDKGAESDDQADAQAEHFLKLQELRSGLLVSRRSANYRFVHLTFQEYLAAWHISKKQDFAEAWKLVKPRIRDPKWFETLQLLGGEWAKGADESLNRYVARLLEVRGKPVASQAPIIALCANVLQDVEGVAEVRSETRKEYETAVKATLHAFRKNSKVPEKTQLEIVEALGQLGAAAKAHMITATKAQRYAVRKRAIEMIVPHIPDDDLFTLQHILTDRSYVPVTTYCQAVIERDPTRALSLLASSLMNNIHERAVVRLHLAVYIAFLEAESKVGTERAFQALKTARPPGTTPELFELVALHAPDALSRESLENAVFSSGWQRRSVGVDLVLRELGHRAEAFELVRKAASASGWRVPPAAFQALGEHFADRPETFELVRKAASASDESVRAGAVPALGAHFADRPETFELVRKAASHYYWRVRQVAVQAVGAHFADRPEAFELVHQAASDSDWHVRQAAVETLGAYFADRRELRPRLLAFARDAWRFDNDESSLKGLHSIRMAIERQARSMAAPV